MGILAYRIQEHTHYFLDSFSLSLDDYAGTVRSGEKNEWATDPMGKAQIEVAVAEIALRRLTSWPLQCPPPGNPVTTERNSLTQFNES
ncbi:hypothetical protein GCM10009574_008550 [Streptomyces asiaticus]|uniref:Uncharacterized protein n=2 Tax=Streptomyces rhizosphaericus TaxID=114699 RepID=A0ABN1S827_9ACTN